jgi:hypothetical protein
LNPAARMSAADHERGYNVTIGTALEPRLRIVTKVARVVERQTREFEGLVVEIPCGFKSRPAHQ